MALPLTNLTFHLDGSVVTDLWQTNVAGSFSIHPVDGGAVNYWDDVEHVTAKVAAIQGAAPLWRSTTTQMPLPCVDFNGASQALKLCVNDGTTGIQTDTLITDTAYTIFIAIYIEGGATNAAAASDNDGILSDEQGAIGIGIKNSGGTYSVCMHNYDTDEDDLFVSITPNASHLIIARHDTGTIYLSVDGGAESSIASGATAALGSGDWLYLGKNWGSGTAYFNGRIGEMAIYNAAISGSNLTDAKAYFTAKWLIPEAPPFNGRIGELGIWNKGDQATALQAIKYLRNKWRI